MFAILPSPFWSVLQESISIIGMFSDAPLIILRFSLVKDSTMQFLHMVGNVLQIS